MLLEYARNGQSIVVWVLVCIRDPQSQLGFSICLDLFLWKPQLPWPVLMRFKATHSFLGKWKLVARVDGCYGLRFHFCLWFLAWVTCSNAAGCLKFIFSTDSIHRCLPIIILIVSLSVTSTFFACALLSQDEPYGACGSMNGSNMYSVFDKLTLNPSSSRIFFHLSNICLGASLLSRLPGLRRQWIVRLVGILALTRM